MNSLKKFRKLSRQKNKLVKETINLISDYIHTNFKYENKLNITVKSEKKDHFSFKVRFEHLNTKRNLYHMFIHCSTNNNYSFYGNNLLDQIKTPIITFDNIILNDNIGFEKIKDIELFKQSDFSILINGVKDLFKKYTDITYQQSLIYLDKYTYEEYGFEGLGGFKEYIRTNTFLDGKAIFKVKYTKYQTYFLVYIKNNKLLVEKYFIKNNLNYKEEEYGFDLNNLFNINSDITERIDYQKFYFLKRSFFNSLKEEKVENSYNVLRNYGYDISLLKDYIISVFKKEGFFCEKPKTFKDNFKQTEHRDSIYNKYIVKVVGPYESQDYPYPKVTLNESFTKEEVGLLLTHNFFLKDVIEYLVKFYPNLTKGINLKFMDFEYYYIEVYGIGKYLKKFYELNDLKPAEVIK